MATLFRMGAAKDSQGTGSERATLKYPSDYSTDLLDKTAQINEGKPDKQLANETLQLTEETPKAERENGMKYKKPLVYKEGQEYISPLVQDSYFYGKDSLEHAEYCIITEGVADCRVLLQASFPCISPVTVQLRDQDYPELISLTKGLKRVYICINNEANEAGLKGALNTAEELETTGIETRIIELPKPEGIDKIDIADYMKEHSPEDFKGLMDSSIRLWAYKLNQQVIPTSSTTLERLTAYKAFISDDLQGMKQEEWKVFVKNDVREHFGLKGSDTKTAILEVAEERDKKQVVADTSTEGPEDNNLDLDEMDISDEEKEDAQIEATWILLNDDPIKYILDTAKKSHTGDEETQEGICISIAGQSCLNTSGIQISVNGESGSGKSHALKTHLHLVPAKYKRVTSLSPKAAYYMELDPGTIIFSDDTTPTPDMEEVIKRATTNYQEYTFHTTVRDGKPLSFKVPPRINWFLTSVDSEVSEQLLNRQLTFNTLNTSEQKNAIFEMQKQEAKNGELGILVMNKEVLVCRRIYDMIKSRLFKVKIDFVDDIEFLDKSNSRVFPLFLDMIKGYTIFFHKQRKTDDQGYLLATKEDFDRAKKLFESQEEGIVSKLNDKERAILNYIAENSGCTISEIAIGTQLSDSTVRSALKGRKDRQSKGFLLEKVKGLKVSDETRTKEAKDGQTFIDRAEHFTFEKGYNVWESLDKGFITLKSDNR